MNRNQSMGRILLPILLAVPKVVFPEGPEAYRGRGARYIAGHRLWSFRTRTRKDHEIRKCFPP